MWIFSTKWATRNYVDHAQVEFSIPLLSEKLCDQLYKRTYIHSKKIFTFILSASIETLIISGSSLTLKTTRSTTAGIALKKLKIQIFII